MWICFDYANPKLRHRKLLAVALLYCTPAEGLCLCEDVEDLCLRFTKHDAALPEPRPASQTASGEADVVRKIWQCHLIVPALLWHDASVTALLVCTKLRFKGYVQKVMGWGGLGWVGLG